MHCSPRSDLWSFFELQVKRVVFGNLELNKRTRRNTGSNVATSQRCEAWSTEESQQVTQRREASTLQSLNVATSQSLNVATSPRFLPQHHKKQGRPNFEALKNVWTAVRKAEKQRLRSLEKTLSFCISSFLINC